MGKSRKLPIFNSYGYNHCKERYRRVIRRSVKNYIRSCKTLEDINNCPRQNEIISRYDWLDYSFDHRKESCGPICRSSCWLWNKSIGYDETRDEVCKECREKYSRK